MTLRSFKRRTLLFVAAALATVATSAPAVAAEPKFDTVRILVGFPPGGMPDTLSRRVAAELTGTYAKSVVVENKAGAGGQLAINEAMRAPNDGSTLLFSPSPMLTLYPHTYPNLPYDMNKDVEPVAASGFGILALAVGPLVPDSVTNVNELVEWVKKNPQHASYATGAPGSPMHFLGALLSEAAGVPLDHVPYRGTPPALLDIIGGQLPMALSSQGEFFAMHRDGKIRILAVAADKRSEALPDVPTFAEQGFPQVDGSGGIMGFFLPGGASPEVVKHAFEALQPVVQRDSVVEVMRQTGLEPGTSASPEEFAGWLRSEYDQWQPIVKRVGFTSAS
ncbi:MAG: tripartite tricarboxylate transporter substrate-binding protein [Pigmentiphaga sp.]